MVRWLLIASMVLVWCSNAWANDTTVLPKGVFVLGAKFGYQFSDKYFQNEWTTKTESIVADYNIEIGGGDLDASLQGYSLGKLDVEYEAFGMNLTLQMGYGITDQISVVMMLPFQRSRTAVNFRLLGSELGTTLDENGLPAAPQVYDPNNPDLHLLDGEILATALSCSNPNYPLCMFRYTSPRETFDRWGIGELITAFRYQFYQSDWFNQGMTLFIKWPTGRHENQNHLFDINFGDQNFDIGFWYGMDFVALRGLPAVHELMFNLTVGYTDQLPDQKEKRMISMSKEADGWEVGTIPLSASWQKMKINRDIGGNWDVYGGFNWAFDEWISLSQEYYFFWKYYDNIWGAEPVPKEYKWGTLMVPDYRALEYATDQSAIDMTTAVALNTIGWFSRGKFPIPMMFSVGYTVTIAGKNFEQNHTFWGSLDLAGMVNLVEMIQAEEMKTTDENLDAEAAAAEEKGKVTAKSLQMLNNMPLQNVGPQAKFKQYPW